MNRILVTGATGFVGMALCKQLFSSGYTVYGTGRNKEKLLKLKRFGINAVGVDLLDRDQFEYCYKYAEPDVIIHLAATVGGIGANKDNPGKFLYETLQTGVNVIDIARKYSCGKVVLLGTVCSYPKHSPVPFREENIWDGYPEETNAPYGIAKKTLMEMLRAYSQQYKMNGITLLPVNLYGPGDNFDLQTSHVIPAMIRKFDEAMDNKKHVVLWGTGNVSREFLYIDDCVSAITLAMEHYNESEPINVGSGQEVTIKKLAEIIANRMHYTGKVIFDSSKPDGQPRRQLEVSKARLKFGFTANTSLIYGIDKTVSWYFTRLKEYNK